MKTLLFQALLLVGTQIWAQQPLTTANFELFGDHIFFQISVDGSEPLDFIFDTGDGLPVLDMEVAERLKLDLDHKSVKTSAQGSITGALIKHNYMELDQLKLEDIPLYATDLDHLEISIGRDIDGILGYDLLAKYVVEIDYNNSQFKLYDPDTYVYKGSGKAHHFRMHNYIPYIPCKVTLNNGEVFEGNYFVNTGAGTTVDFNTPFARKNNMIEKTGEHYSYLVKGLGDAEFVHYEGRLKEFDIGEEIQLHNLAVGISKAESGIQNNKKMDGIIGNKVLKRFNLICDYKNNDIYFEKHKDYDEEFHVNACGFEIQYATSKLEKVLVHKVYEIGPAKNNDIEADDELLSINGKSVGEMTLPEITKVLNMHDTSVDITIKKKSTGEIKEVTLELDDLI